MVCPFVGHLDCLQDLAIVNKTAMDILVEVFLLYTCFLWGKYPEVELLSHMESIRLTL